jgi:hypothetical protein
MPETAHGLRRNTRLERSARTADRQRGIGDSSAFRRELSTNRTGCCGSFRGFEKMGLH